MKITSKRLLIVSTLIALHLLVILPIRWIYVSVLSPRLIDHKLNGNIVIRLPETTRIIRTPIGELREVISSLYFSDESLAIRGYAQLWQIDDLERFLVVSRSQSTFDYKSYHMNRFRIGHLYGFVTEWTASFGDFYYITGSEYWLKKDDSSSVLRISFFVDKTSFSDNQLNYIHQIASSIRW